MTKKDFQAIARAIHKASWGSERVRVEDVISRVADALAETNPRFDRARFIEACETGTCKGMKG